MTKLTKFKQWIILKLIGRNSVMVNCEIKDSHIYPRSTNWCMFVNDVFHNEDLK